MPYHHPRFTPTGVGTMIRNRRHNTCISVHPHGRGDYGDAVIKRCHNTGSPPRAWGQLGFGALQRDARRFTPTGVGTMDWLSQRA